MHDICKLFLKGFNICCWTTKFYHYLEPSSKF